MDLKVGAVCEGTVTGITKFGAFVSLGEGKSGLVHISEIADTYVSDVSAFLSVGQTVRVRVTKGDESEINDYPAASVRRLSQRSEPETDEEFLETPAESVEDESFSLDDQ